MNVIYNDTHIIGNKISITNKKQKRSDFHILVINFNVKITFLLFIVSNNDLIIMNMSIMVNDIN